MSAPPIGYVLKMFPRFSETFVLSEVLELERQGLDLRIFSLKRPDDGLFHAEVANVRAPVTYLPEPGLGALRAYAAAHREVFGWDRRRYVGCLARTLWRSVKKRRAGALRRFAQAGYFAPVLRRDGVQHVHAHFASSATAVALHLYDLAGTSYSFTAHAKDIYRETVERSSLERKLGSASFAVTVSDFNRDYLRQFAGGERVVRVYNGLDVERFAPNGVARDEPPLVLGVGRLVEKKGFAELVQACSLLHKRGEAFQCLIVGKGELERPLRELISALGVERQVELAGPVPRERLLDVYARASVVVAPCIVGADGNRDGLPTVLVEAMSLGVPVVATAVTGIPELVDDGRTGLVVPERDPEALAAAIRRILGHPEEARAFASAGRERILRDFDQRANVARLNSLLQKAGRR